MSRIQAAGKCMRMMSLDDEADTAGEDAAVGRLVHEAAKTAGEYARLAGVEWLSSCQLEHIARNVIRSSEDQVGPLSMENWADVIRLTRRLAHTHDGPPPFPLGAEYEIPARRMLDGRVISARIDWRLIEDATCWIKDTKTGGKQAAREATFQGKVYAWQTLWTHPWIEEFWLAEHCLPYGGPRWVWLGAEQLTGRLSVEEFLRDEIIRLEAAYADQPFKPTPGSHCKDMCPDPEGCPLPEWTKGRKIQTDDDAADVLDTVVVLRARAAKLTTNLKAHVIDREKTHVTSIDHGQDRVSVKTGDLEYGFNYDGSKCEIRKARQ